MIEVLVIVVHMKTFTKSMEKYQNSIDSKENLKENGNEQQENDYLHPPMTMAMIQIDGNNLFGMFL